MTLCSTTTRVSTPPLRPESCIEGVVTENLSLAVRPTGNLWFYTAGGLTLLYWNVWNQEIELEPFCPGRSFHRPLFRLQGPGVCP